MSGQVRLSCSLVRRSQLAKLVWFGLLLRLWPIHAVDAHSQAIELIPCRSLAPLDQVHDHDYNHEHEHDTPVLLYSFHELDGSSSSNFHSDCSLPSPDVQGDTQIWAAMKFTSFNETEFVQAGDPAKWVPDKPGPSWVEEQTVCHDWQRPGSAPPTWSAGHAHCAMSDPMDGEHHPEDHVWLLKANLAAQLVREFGILHFMRNRRIDCALYRIHLDNTPLDSLSPRINSFLAAHPHLLHADTGVFWLQELPEHQLGEGGQAFGYEMESPGDAEGVTGTGFVAKLRGFGLPRLFDAIMYSKFGIGSLDFLVIPNRTLPLNQVNSVNNVHGPHARDPPVQTLSASMFLAKKSACSCTQGETNHRTFPQRLPYATEYPVQNNDGKCRLEHGSAGVGSLGGSPPGPDVHNKCHDGMKELHELWEFLAREMNRQESIPGLRSGNTVIDERNFRPWQSLIAARPSALDI